MTERSREARRTPAARQTPSNPDAEQRRATLPTDGMEFQASAQRTGPPDIEPATGRQAEVIDEEPDLTTTAHTLGDAPIDDASDPNFVSPDVEPSLVDQELLTDPVAAPGPNDSWEDPVESGDEAYTPPTDPVVTAGAHGDTRVLGGFSADAEEERRPLRSSDGQVGDEAIADAVRAALRQDATTTDLQVDVAVEAGIVRLFGEVAGMEDVDNAEAVAGRVPGVVDVVDELHVAGV